MPIAATRSSPGSDLVGLARDAAVALEALLGDATARVRERVAVEGHVVSRLFDREQRAAHGLAWLATYVEAVRQMAAYAERMAADGNLGEIEEHLVRIGIGEYIAQILGGIPMSQNEVVRPADMGLSMAQVAARVTPAMEELVATGNTAERRNAARLVEDDRSIGIIGVPPDEQRPDWIDRRAEQYEPRCAKLRLKPQMPCRPFCC